MKLVNKKALFGAAVAGLMITASVAHAEHADTHHGDGAEVGECHGINSCKGTGACGGEGHSCAGKNTCKGHGWLKLSKADCEAKHGTFKKH